MNDKESPGQLKKFEDTELQVLLDEIHVKHKKNTQKNWVLAI